MKSSEFENSADQYAYQYYGYSACSSRNSIWLGGFNEVEKDYDYKSMPTSMYALNRQYCTNSNCECPSNLTLKGNVCDHGKNDNKDDNQLVLIISLSVSAVIIIIIIVIVIVLLVIFVIQPKRKESTKFKLKNYNCLFSTIDNFPLTFDNPILSFDCGTQLAKVKKEMTQEIHIANPTKKTYYYFFDPENYQSHRFTIDFEPKQGKLSPGYGEKNNYHIQIFMYLSSR